MDFSAYANHYCGVTKSDGSLQCFGSNSRGQATPVAGRFIAVAAGGDFTCALRWDQAIVCFGSNEFVFNLCGIGMGLVHRRREHS